MEVLRPLGIEVLRPLGREVLRPLGIEVLRPLGIEVLRYREQILRSRLIFIPDSQTEFAPEPDR